MLAFLVIWINLILYAQGKSFIFLYHLFNCCPFGGSYSALKQTICVVRSMK